ncbi:TetR/AcrR family transcriptional regulator [Ruminococcaceae bacterium OttesenSCG-928-A16]|nr:TetR/AcrR family transcriptional regulator [Ruminococcaceae bacterium OttesenSCG-928-A16]
MPKPKARVTKAPEERRAELILAARELFDKNGIDKTRVSDIVKRVGVAQGVFYYYFNSKTEMINAVVEQVEAEIKQRISLILADETANFYKKLADYIELYIDLIDQFLADDVDCLPVPESEFYEQSLLAQQGQQLLGQSLQTLIKQGVEDGTLTLRYPQQTAGVLLLGLRGISAVKLPTRTMVYSIVEQSLCLPGGKLMQYMKPPKQKK